VLTADSTARPSASGPRFAYKSLGGGVWLRTGDPGADTEVIEGRHCRRFMDHLYLPREPEELGIDAIKAINRWRETVVASSGLSHRDRVRELVTEAYRVVGRGNMLEVGCGKFPLGPELAVSTYLGIDIDDEAVRYNAARGIRIALSVNDAGDALEIFDVVASLFVLQFPVSDETLDAIALTTSPDVVFLFNIVTREPDVRARMVDRLVWREMNPVAVDLGEMGAHDVLFAASREQGVARRDAALEAVHSRLRRSWPQA
jgi:hypothetical protein